jgi:hypothetical protein
MKLHANAPLSPKARQLLIDRIERESIGPRRRRVLGSQRANSTQVAWRAIALNARPA